MKRAQKVIFYKSAFNSKWYWHVTAANGKILSDSGQGYVRLADCRRGYDLVRNKETLMEIKC